MYTNYKISRLFITFTEHKQSMRYFVVFLFMISSLFTYAQSEAKKQETINGTIVSDITLQPVAGVNIININKMLYYSFRVYSLSSMYTTIHLGYKSPKMSSINL